MAAYPLRRPLLPMPEDVECALKERGLRAAYDARPPYQRNDYLAWLARAKRDEVRARRLERMLGELEAGHGYLGRDWHPK